MREEAYLYDMKYSPYPPYEILSIKDISYEELLVLKKVEEMVDKYYNSQKFNNIIKYFIPKFNNHFDFYLALGNFFDKKGYVKRNIGNSEYYKVFLDFNMEILKGDNSILGYILKFDYLSLNKKRGMPSFLERPLIKEKEQEIRNQLRGEYSLKDYQLETFNININKFMHNGEITNERTYFLFLHEGEVSDVTNKISK